MFGESICSSLRVPVTLTGCTKTLGTTTACDMPLHHAPVMRHDHHIPGCLAPTRHHMMGIKTSWKHQAQVAHVLRASDSRLAMKLTNHHSLLLYQSPRTHSVPIISHLFCPLLSTRQDIRPIASNWITPTTSTSLLFCKPGPHIKIAPSYSVGQKFISADLHSNDG